MSLLLYAIHSDSKVWDLRWRSPVSNQMNIPPPERSTSRYISHLANVSLDSRLRENPTKTHRKDSISSSAIAYFQKVLLIIYQISFQPPTVECGWRGSLVHDLLEGFPYVWIFSTALQRHCFMKQDCLIMWLKKSMLNISRWIQNVWKKEQKWKPEERISYLKWPLVSMVTHFGEEKIWQLRKGNSDEDWLQHADATQADNG